MVRPILADKHVPVEFADEVTGIRATVKVPSTGNFGSSYAARDALDFKLADNIVRFGVTTIRRQL